MNAYTVILENADGECKRVTVTAASPCDAMAEAQIQNDGWTPVGVE